MTASRTLMWSVSGCRATGLGGIMYAMGETSSGMFEIYDPFRHHEDLTQKEAQRLCQEHYDEYINQVLIDLDAIKKEDVEAALDKCVMAAECMCPPMACHGGDHCLRPVQSSIIRQKELLLKMTEPKKVS